MSNEFEQMLARLRAEFIDICIDKLDFVDTAVTHFSKDKGRRGENYLDVQREIHSIKGSAGTHGFNSISIIAHRLEDYVKSKRRLSANDWQEVQKFVDAIRDIIESREELDEAGIEKVLNALPKGAYSTIETKEGKKVTLLLVMQKNFQRKLICISSDLI